MQRRFKLKEKHINAVDCLVICWQHFAAFFFFLFFLNHI